MENKEFVIVITHSYDAIERAAAALQLATNMRPSTPRSISFSSTRGAPAGRGSPSRSRGRRDSRRSPTS